MWQLVYVRPALRSRLTNFANPSTAVVSTRSTRLPSIGLASVGELAPPPQLCDGAALGDGAWRIHITSGDTDVTRSTLGNCAVEGASCTGSPLCASRSCCSCREERALPCYTLST